MTSPAVWRLDGQLLGLLSDLQLGSGVELERVEAGAYVVVLHGRRRPRTLLWLLAGEQAVTVEAFVMHVIPDGCPDPSALHRWVLRRNLGLRSVHFSVDDVGDLFLTGSLPASELDAGRLDGLLGEVWQLLEDSTPALLSRAYGDRLERDPVLAAKVLADGAGRRPAGTPDWAPRRDVRR